MKNYIPSLNGLRAICILIVIFFHLDQNHFIAREGVLKYVSLFFFNGPLGVNIFFAISGFLITTLLLREESNEGAISLKGFYYRRTVRIFPAYYFLLLIYFVLSLAGYFKLSRIDWISSLTYTKQFFGGDVSHETAHLWSLSVEEVFYLVWPVLFICFKRYRAQISLLFMLGCCLFRCLTFKFEGPNFVNIIYSSGDALAVGCLFALYKDQVVVWMSNKRYLMMLVLPAILLSVICYKYIYHLRSSGRYDVTLDKVWLPIAYGFLGQIGTLTNILIGLLIIYSISFKTIWFRFLNLSVMNYIGKISYSLYLWQQLFTADREYLHRLPIVVIFAMTFAAACFSYYLIEKPFLKLKDRFVVNRRQAIQSS